MFNTKNALVYVSFCKFGRVKNVVCVSVGQPSLGRRCLDFWPSFGATTRAWFGGDSATKKLQVEMSPQFTQPQYLGKPSSKKICLYLDFVEIALTPPLPPPFLGNFF